MNKLLLSSGIVLILEGILLCFLIPFIGVPTVIFGIVCVVSNFVHPKSNKAQPITATPIVVSKSAPKTYKPVFLSDYVIFDLETTGLDINACEIIEIAAIKVRNNTIVNTFQTFVKPSGSIPPEATKVNHITNDMVFNAPTPFHAMHAFKAYIEDLPLIGYNIKKYDLPIVERYFNNIGIKHPEFKTIDLYEMVINSSLPLTKKRLVDVAAYFGVDQSNAHRALGDCYMTYGVYQGLNARPENGQAYQSSDRIDNIVFKGSAFVVTGQFKSYPREEIEKIITDMGGLLRTAVSSRTDYLIVGSLGSEAYTVKHGKKVEKALQLQTEGKKVQIINEDDFIRCYEKVR